MHAAPMLHRREIVTLRNGIALVASENDCLALVASTPIAIDDRLGHAARRRYIEHIVPLLYEGDGVSFFVFDKRREAEHNWRGSFTSQRTPAAVPGQWIDPSRSAEQLTIPNYLRR